MLEQVPPPRLTLITRAGVGLAGTLGTDRPPAQRMPSTVSESSAPQRPETRTGWMRAFQSTPAMFTPLLVSAPSVPATRVPCQLLLVAVVVGVEVPGQVNPTGTPSPASVASASRPPPSLAMDGSVMKS